MKKAIKKVTVVETVWTDIPKEAKDVIRQLWIDREYGNDYYYLSTTIEDLIEEGDHTLPLVTYLRSEGVEDKEELLLHYWW